MHVHINHMFCTDSNWGGDYNSRYMVSISRHLSYDPKTKEEKDWTDLLEKRDFLDQETYERYKESKYFKDRSDESLREMAMSTTWRLTPKVFKWLENNVEDSKKNGHKGEKGFCVGTDSYNNRSEGFSIFFYRRSDALKFIKTWSVYKKPTTYFDYFKGIRKELDLKTGKIKKVEKFTLI